MKLDLVTTEGWVRLRAGAFTVATLVTPVRGEPEPLVIAVAVEGAPVSVRRPAAAKISV